MRENEGAVSVCCRCSLKLNMLSGVDAVMFLLFQEAQII